jgi:hypothetical protein
MIVTDYYDDFFLFEYTIGVGITAKLHNRWHLNGGGGFSLARFRPNFIPSVNSVFDGRNPITEGAFIYRKGINYLLK